MKETIKSLVKPIQKQLLKRGMCVACGMPLSKAEHTAREDGKEKVVCKCGRIFIFDPAEQTYRRANFDEV
jgi:hypothetical protein